MLPVAELDGWFTAPGTVPLAGDVGGDVGGLDEGTDGLPEGPDADGGLKVAVEGLGMAVVGVGVASGEAAGDGVESAGGVAAGTGVPMGDCVDKGGDCGERPAPGAVILLGGEGTAGPVGEEAIGTGPAGLLGMPGDGVEGLLVEPEGSGGVGTGVADAGTGIMEGDGKAATDGVGPSGVEEVADGDKVVLSVPMGKPGQRPQYSWQYALQPLQSSLICDATCYLCLDASQDSLIAACRHTWDLQTCADPKAQQQHQQ